MDKGLLMSELAYKRVLLKLSGAAMRGDLESGIDFGWLDALVSGPIKTLVADGAQIGVVIGGGNILRGAEAEKSGVAVDRAVLDDLGMLSTVMNSLALCGALEGHGISVRVLSATPMDKIADYYTRDRARALLDDGVVTIMAGGTGNPYFTTDTAAALRGAEIGADALLKATDVDGVYDRDPKKYADAVRYARLSYDEAIERRLKVMDLTAFSICREQRLPIIVLSLDPLDTVARLMRGEDIGTTVGGQS